MTQLQRLNLDAFLAERLDRAWKQYERRLARARKQCTEKAVHRLRVQTRRLLSLLDLLRIFEPGPTLRRTRRAFKKRLDLFDKLRDVQVHLPLLREAVRTHPEAQPVLEYFERREKRLIKKVGKRVRKLGTARLEKRIQRLRRHLRRMGADPERRALHWAQVRTALEDAFARTLALRQQINPAEPETLHRTRIAFKKFRYMVEWLAPYWVPVTRHQLEQMHAFQNRLGEIQDLETLLAALDRAVRKGKVPGWRARALQAYWQRRFRERIRQFLATADELTRFRPPTAFGSLRPRSEAQTSKQP